MDSCVKHPHEPGAALCGRCGGAWCNDCIVYAYGPKKPPLCLGCAMVAGGVRSASARPAMPRRQLKALQKAAKAEAKAAAKAAKAAGKAEPEPVEETAAAMTAAPVVEPELVAPVANDWERPWWEDRQPTFAD